MAVKFSTSSSWCPECRQPATQPTDSRTRITRLLAHAVQFNGGPILGNQFFLDGGMNTVPAINEISVVPMVDAVAEFRVETNGMKAEFGQTSGGVVNVVTKSGSNQFHGSLYEFFRNDATASVRSSECRFALSAPAVLRGIKF